MKRGDLYRVKKANSADPKAYRVFVVVSRQALIDSRFSTIICAPVYSAYDGLSTQLRVGVESGLKHESSIHCDELISLPKAALTHFVGGLSGTLLKWLDEALTIALDGEVVIARSGKPVARLVPFREKKERRPGSARGAIVVADDFDAPLPPDVIDTFEK